MGPLHIQAGLDGPIDLSLRHVSGIERWAARRTEDREGRGRGNPEGAIEDGQVIRDRWAAKGIDDENGLATSIQARREVVSGSDEVGRVTDKRFHACTGAIGHRVW